MKEFNEKIAMACRSLGWVGVPAREPSGQEAPLSRAAAQSDWEWAEELVGQGADPMQTFVHGYGSGASLFGRWWSGAQAHPQADPRRLAKMVEWLDGQGVGLGHFEEPGALRKVRSHLRAGGASKAAARVRTAREWLELPVKGIGYSREEHWRPGLRALMGRAAAWSADPRQKARAGAGELLDEMCAHAGATRSGLLALTEARAGLGIPIGPRRWAMVADGLAGAKKTEDLALALARALASDSWEEPLGREAATKMAAQAIFEGSAELLGQVCKVAQDIDWALPGIGAQLARRCLGDDELAASEGGFSDRQVGAVQLARLAMGHKEKYGQNHGSTRELRRALHAGIMSIPDAVEACKAHPLPEAFVYSSPTEAAATARAHPELAAPDGRGRSLAHVWALGAKWPQDIERVGRLMGTPLAKLVSAADSEGRAPRAMLAKLAGAAPACRAAFDALEGALAKWERSQIGKEVGRKSKTPSPKARRI